MAIAGKPQQLAKPKSYLSKPAWVRPGYETYYWNLNRSLRIGPSKFDPWGPESNQSASNQEDTQGDGS